MLIKKSGGKIFGAELTAAERKAMNLEIQRQVAEYNEKNIREVDAIILWFFRKYYGFGEKRLKRIHDWVIQSVRDLDNRYEMTDESDHLWLYTKMLLDDGIDISKWE